MTVEQTSSASRAAASEPGGTASVSSVPRGAGTIVVLNRDLFFGVKIGNTLRSLGYEVAFVRSTADFVARLSEGGAAIVLGIIDMNAGADWPEIAVLTAQPRHAPILVFGSHLDVEGRRTAKAAGVTRVLSNGDFHRDMVALVRRYARRAGP